MCNAYVYARTNMTMQELINWFFFCFVFFHFKGSIVAEFIKTWDSTHGLFPDNSFF